MDAIVKQLLVIGIVSIALHNNVQGQSDIKSSLTFVIDNTASMQDDINYVKEQIRSIFQTVHYASNSPIEEYILVTFGDPFVFSPTITRNEHEFKRKLNDIYVNGGQDCPEMSMSGIETALSVSKPGSYLYVFTDADAKDYHKSDYVTQLAVNKGCKVTFIVSGNCDKRHTYDPVYMNIAKATYGEVFFDKKNAIPKILQYVKETVKTRRIPIKQETFAPGRNKFYFHVDGSIGDVIISITGYDIWMYVTKPDGMQAQTIEIVKTDRVTIVKVLEVIQGNYVTYFYSGEMATATVSGLNTLHFEYRFSFHKPKTIKETTLQPYPGKKCYLSVIVNGHGDRLHSVKIQDLNHRDILEYTLVLINEKDQFYTTRMNFIPPITSFFVAIKGYDQFGTEFTRNGIVPIHNQIVAPKLQKQNTDIITYEKRDIKIQCKFETEGNPKPKIYWEFKPYNSNRFTKLKNMGDIISTTNTTVYDTGVYKCTAVNDAGKDEASTYVKILAPPRIKLTTNIDLNEEVPYNGNLIADCDVTANPEARIEWTDEHDVPVQGVKISETRPQSFVRISRISVEKLKKSTQYHCKVLNTLERKTLMVRVSPPFIVGKFKAIKLEYGNEANLICNIKSTLDSTITWIKEINRKGDSVHSVKLVNSKLYVISSDGTKLKINRVDIQSQGTYKCVAKLRQEPEVTATYRVDVTIGNLAPPKIENSISNMIVNETHYLKLECKITEGNPKPTVSWQFKPYGTSEYKPIQSAEEKLIISKTAFSDSGLYKCTAVNVAGSDENIVNVSVQGPLRVKHTQALTRCGLTGDQHIKIYCNVLGYPRPSISWSFEGALITNGEKYDLENNAIVVKFPKIKDSGKYTCTANNIFGSVVSNHNLQVTDELDYLCGNVTDVYVPINKPSKLNCPLNSTVISWFKNGEKQDFDGKIWYIENPTEEYDGNYTCRAFDSTGGATSYTFAVDVGYPPYFTRSQDSNDLDWKGEECYLDCEVNAKPTPNITWTLNGKTVDETSSTISLEKWKWGNYSCHVENPHDSTDRDFVVFSSGCVVERKLILMEKTPVMKFGPTTIPRKSNFNLKSKDTITLTCNDGMKTSNALLNIPQQGNVIVTCDHEDNFLLNGNTYKLEHFHCNSKVEPNVEFTGQKCNHGNAEIVAVTLSSVDMKLYEVCFDKARNVPIYSKVVITKLHSVDVKPSPWHTFEGFGNDLRNYNCTGNKYCAKLQLINGEYLPYGTSYASFIDNLNSVPVLIDVNWDKIEETELPTIWTGASNYTEINGDLVPRYLWKVLKRKETTWALVTINDPEPVKEDKICSKCPSLLDASDNTYCCHLSVFSKLMGISEEDITSI